ncbi:MAG TPA: Na+/H+ antiporter [Candidatus Limnocylindrales bacterium]
MPDFDLILVLLVAVAVIVSIARRIGVAYPILLVIGGIVLGLVPGVPEIDLDPSLVLVIFLPPLVFAAAWETPVRDFRENLVAVLLLSVGLVLFTVAVVGVAALAVVPGLLVAGAFVLGAIVAPSDALAATTVLERVDVPRRVRAVLEEESLLNDATALTAYRTAVIAALSGSFVLGDALSTFAVATLGGLAIGLLVAGAVDFLWERLDDPPVEVTLSLVIPYVAFLPAEAVGASGVIAAVTAGIILGYRSPRILSPETRLLATSAWEMLTFVLNGFAFLLVGLEVRPVLATIERPLPELVVGAIAVSVAVIGARAAWVYGALYLPHLVARFRGRPSKAMRPAVPLVVSWAGMRGAISLAAALALPATFEDRNLILILTAVVIAVTLLGQGLTLPLVVRLVELPPGTIDVEEETLARNRQTEAALARLDELGEEWAGHAPLIENLRGRYRHRLEHLPDEDESGERIMSPERQQELDEHHLISTAVIAAERETLIGLRDRAEISDAVLRRLERELDLEEARLEVEL